MEVDSVGDLRHVLALHGECPESVSQHRRAHEVLVQCARRTYERLGDRSRPAAVLYRAATEPGETGVPSCRDVFSARVHEVVVMMGDRSAAVGMEAERERG